MNTLIQHLVACRPSPLNTFFTPDDQCEMLVRMASNGQNDAFVALIKAGAGAQNCPRSRHPVNFAARYNYDLLLRLLRNVDGIEGKLGIESISSKLPAQHDFDGRSLVENVCLNEKNDHPHGELIVKTVLEKFGDQKSAADGKDVPTSQTRLHDACRVGNLGSVRVLLEKAATVDVVDSLGRTPLFFVADGSKGGSTAERRGRGLDIAARLLEKMSPEFVNKPAKSDGEQTALHKAVASANVELVKLLVVEKNADRSVTDAAGLTPLDYCAEKSCRQSELSLNVAGACDGIATILRS